MCLPKKIAANKHPQLFLQTGSNNTHHQPTFSSSQSDNNPGPNIVSTMTNGTTGRKRPRSPSSTSSAATTTSSASSSASHQQQRRGRVRFANTPHEVVGTVEPCSSMSELTKTTIWYPQSELDRFKDAARDAGRKMRTEELRRGPSHHPTTTTQEEEEGDTHRGLEHRTSLERQRNKYVALRAVVECYRRLQTGAVTVDSRVCEPDVHLALVSSKVTRWAREVALSTGQSDFLDAYPMLRGVVPPPRTVEEIGRAHPFPLALKRRSSFGGGQAGRVSPLRASSPPLPVLPEVKVPPSTAASSSSGAATPPIVSPVPSPVTLSPVSLPAHPTAVEEDEDSDDEARRRMTKRQRTSVSGGHHHAHHGLTLVVL